MVTRESLFQTLINNTTLTATLIVFIAAIGLITAPSISLADSSQQGYGAKPISPSNQIYQLTPQERAESVQRTQNMLRSPTERQQAINADQSGAARKADDTTRKLLGNQNTEKAYSLSADLLQQFVAQTGGDPEKLQALILELQSNPHALEKYLSPAQREQIRGMASDIEKSQGAAPAAGSGF